MNAFIEHQHDADCAPRTCRKCETLKWGCEFYGGKEAGRKVCKRCQLAANREWRMTDGNGQQRNWLNRGVEFTIADYDRMLKEQDGKCAICPTSIVELEYAAPLDHDHKTGVVRGILCRSCNIMLGHAKDDVSILLAAAKYLVDRGGQD